MQAEKLTQELRHIIGAANVDEMYRYARRWPGVTQTMESWMLKNGQHQRVEDLPPESFETRQRHQSPDEPVMFTNHEMRRRLKTRSPLTNASERPPEGPQGHQEAEKVRK